METWYDLKKNTLILVSGFRCEKSYKRTFSSGIIAFSIPRSSPYMVLVISTFSLEPEIRHLKPVNLEPVNGNKKEVSV